MKQIINPLKGNSNKIPIWFMRQAGRYLPEYKKVRETTKNFLDFCYDVNKATEVTLQPIKRYGFDAAIIFSDILVLPHALGWEVDFKENIGPILKQFKLQEDFKYLQSNPNNKLEKVYEIIKKVKEELPSTTSLIGFVGSPWTVMSYMLEGKGKQDFKTSKKFIYENKILAKELLNFITEKTADHLINQAKSGADVLKLFDSWSGVLGEEEFTEFVIEPTKKIILKVKEAFPKIPIIAFPKGAGLLYEKFIKEVPIDILAVDQMVPLEKMKEWSDKVIVQGNLDPVVLLTNKEIIKEKAYKILQTMKGKSFIFNLGHGILPETPPENVEFLTEYVKLYEEKNSNSTFNLGGPKNLESVKPFLFNLFYDKAIINLPNPLRYIIAKIISITRERKSQKIYSLIGDKSFLLQETEEQKLALTEKLKKLIKEDFAIFINMRYSAPFAREVINQIKKYNPSEIILLPLYPQFSSTTTGSSVKNFLQNFDIDIPIKTICCYPLEEDFIKSHVSLIKEKLYDDDKNFRILFSAHGLPEKIIKAGDPYSFQIKETVKAIVKELNIKDLDYKITYQSRVGPVEWLKPNTEDEIELAGKLKKDIIIVPISFVSEHVETLVELDIEYKLIADKYEIQYIRIPTLGTNKIFINSLTNILLQFINKVDTNLVTSSSSTRICPNEFTKCLCKLTN